MNPDRFREITSQFSNHEILVVGDLMLDAYLWGSVDRISPEAPVPVVHVLRKNFNPGGAGNVALNLATLNARVRVAGILGLDDDGQRMLDSFKANKIDTGLILQDPATMTTVKTRVIARSQQVVRIDNENPGNFSPDVYLQFLQKIRETIPGMKAVILEDYNKGLFTPTVIREIISCCRVNLVPVYVDPKFDNIFEYRNVRFFKPNFTEFKASLGEPVSADNFLEKGFELRKKLNAEVLLVTRGGAGVTLFTEDGAETIPTKARQVHDVSGAGDSVISTFTMADLSGATPREAAQLANYAAGKVCEEVGVVSISIEKLSEIIDYHANQKSY